MDAVPSRADRIGKFANMAATDAHHDFDSSRGEGAFRRIFVDQGIKDIGTPVTPTRLEDEATILDAFLHFKGEGRDEVADFRRTFLQVDFAGAVFKRDSEDPIEYDVKSMKLCSRAKDSGKAYEYGDNTADSFFRFIDSDMTGNAAFLIDAVSVSFYNIFSVPGDGARVHGNAYFLNSREAVNDGAGKIDMGDIVKETEEGNYTVKVHELNDTLAEPVVYPSTDLNDISEPKTLFYSIFNITMSPIGAVSGKKSIMMSYSTTGFEDSSIVIQGLRDEAANSVSALTKRLLNIFGGGRDAKKDRAYFKILQQKRGGDWLQVLSCLDGARYPDLPAGTPIILCTHDRICAAYALAMGINVLFTHIWRTDQGNTEHWVVYCRKRVGAAAVNEEEIRQARLARLPNPAEPLAWLGVVPGRDPLTYAQLRDMFISVSASEFEAIKGEIPATRRAIMSELAKAQLNLLDIGQAIKKYLNAWSTLSIWRRSIPVIRSDNEETLNTDKHIALYETQNIVMKRVLVGHDTINLMEAVTAAYSKIRRGLRTNVLLDKIERINVMRGLFAGYSDTDIKTNGTGIFTLLRQSLMEGERMELIETLKLVSQTLTARGLYPAVKKYGVFLDTATLLIQGVGDGPDVPNWVLLAAQTEQEVVSEPTPSALAALATSLNSPDFVFHAPPQQRGGAEPEESEHLALSDSYGPSVILAKRFKRGKGNSMATIYQLASSLATDLEMVHHETVRDPSFEYYSTYTMRYLAQLLQLFSAQFESILQIYKGNAKVLVEYKTKYALRDALYNGLEKYMLNDILMEKGGEIYGPDLRNYMLNFLSFTYGAEDKQIHLGKHDIAISNDAVSNFRFRHNETILETVNALRVIMRNIIVYLQAVEPVEGVYLVPAVVVAAAAAAAPRTPSRETRKAHPEATFTNATLKKSIKSKKHISAAEGRKSRFAKYSQLKRQVRPEQINI
jgi:hypothetical protein